MYSRPVNDGVVRSSGCHRHSAGQSEVLPRQHQYITILKARVTVLRFIITSNILNRSILLTFDFVVVDKNSLDIYHIFFVKFL